MDELSEREYGKEEEEDALLRIFGMSANEHLGGRYIIRANIQDARQPS